MVFGKNTHFWVLHNNFIAYIFVAMVYYSFIIPKYSTRNAGGKQYVSCATEGTRSAMEGVRSVTEGVRSAMEGVRSAMEGVRSVTEGVRYAMEGYRHATEGYRHGVKKLTKSINIKYNS
ncbi:MAG: hypothetical protein ACYDCN_13865 [Bacteroidia bacterium]